MSELKYTAMTDHDKIKRLFAGTMCLLLLAGCYKNMTVIFDTGEEITRTVTFSGDIQPIFAKSCSLSGCHVAGGQVPDLTETNAYASLLLGNYVDTLVPTNSHLYLKMSGKQGTPMPVSGSNKEYNSLVLAWIKQGAHNN